MHESGGREHRTSFSIEVCTQLVDLLETDSVSKDLYFVNKPKIC